MKKKFNFGVIRPFLRDEQHLIRYYANEHENTLPMLSRSHYKLNHSDTMTVASVVLRGMILNGWTCQQTYAWWQDYRHYIADTWGTCSRDVLCGPKIFQRAWTEIAQLLPAYQERMKEFPTQWFYMNIIDWTGTPRKWFFDSPDVASAVHYYNLHRRSDYFNQEYRSLYSVTWDGQKFINPRRVSLSKAA